MDRWKVVIDRMESSGVRDNEFLLELVNYQYGYIGWCLGVKRYEEAKRYLALAETHLDVLWKDKANKSMVESYRSAFYGYRIGLNKITAPFLGPKSMDYAKRAVESGSTNAFAYVQLGNIQFYMPSTFGGSKKEALEYFLKAKELMESDNGNIVENWNYLSVLTLIAQSHYYLHDYRSSMAYIEKILTIAPEYGWVKNDLRKMVLQKMTE